MAARVKKIRHDEETRAKIQASQLINRLQSHVFDNVEMSATQLKAAEILLRKTLPDLTAAEITQETTVRYVARLPEKTRTVDEWQQQHSQPTIQ